MEELYSLRNKFAIIAITGRTGSGCSQIANKLSDNNYINGLKPITTDNTNVDSLKFNICLKYLQHNDNWKSFEVIKYTNVVLFHLLYECCFQSNIVEAKEKFISTLCGGGGKDESARFCDTDEYYNDLKQLANEFIEQIFSTFEDYGCETLQECVSEKRTFYGDFFENTELIEEFISKLRDYDAAKTTLLFHDLAFYLRSNGKALERIDVPDNNATHIYTVAETINRLIKCYRERKGNGRIVIDSIKNSLELIYFKEKYSAFYSIATNKLSQERIDYKRSRIKHHNPEYIADKIIKIDNIEYKGGQVTSGNFSVPDIENCIQRSGYHIFYTNDFDKYSDYLEDESRESVDLDVQLVKFISLLFQPGIITPTAFERNMQIAFNAKANSGCISRQVGAVITDKNHAVKSIGWNDVAANQIPCNLRNLVDISNDKNPEHFSDFEKGIDGEYKDGETFKMKVTSELKTIEIDKLNGKNCAFCFKTFHNVFEGMSNQVHTRSLHAEENAMLQLTKYGGQGVENGILYTTASPCELCSKKAFQLGIKEVIYIDPYPGIATKHILKSGKTKQSNPTLKMFRGAVGSTFHKLYEPIMSYKDELNILADVHPVMNQERVIKKLTGDSDKQEQIRQILNK